MKLGKTTSGKNKWEIKKSIGGIPQLGIYVHFHLWSPVSLLLLISHLLFSPISFIKPPTGTFILTEDET